MPLFSWFLLYPHPCLDVADDGLAALIDVDVLDPDGLLTFAPVLVEGFHGYESGGQEFESLRARTKLGTPAAATPVITKRSKTSLRPWMRIRYRQHPRDLFYVRDLLEHEGITDDLRRAFIVYLISHDRPISEVIVPRRKDIAQEFAQSFEGMTAEPVALEALLRAREELIAAVAGDMPDHHKTFLLGFKRGEPDWSLLGVPGAEALPAVKWKRINLDKLTRDARNRLVFQLTELLT